MSEVNNTFRIHAGLPALGGVEWLEAMANKLEHSQLDLTDHPYLAAGLRNVSRTIRSSVLQLDVDARRSALALDNEEARRGT